VEKGREGVRLQRVGRDVQVAGDRQVRLLGDGHQLVEQRRTDAAQPRVFGHIELLDQQNRAHDLEHDDTDGRRALDSAEREARALRVAERLLVVRVDGGGKKGQIFFVNRDDCDHILTFIF